MSTDSFSSSSVVQVDVDAAPPLHSLLPFAAGYTAPPPTPLASTIPPPLPSHDLTLLHNPPAAAADNNNDHRHNTTSFPSTSSLLASPPSKEDLDALAQYLMHHSLHSTPPLLSSPSLRRKRRPPTSALAHADNNEKAFHAPNYSRHYINVAEVVQTFSYARGFRKESRSGIQEACQDVGAFYIDVQDAKEALTMLGGRHCADDESIVEGGLIPISQLLTSTSQLHHQQDMLELEPPLALDLSAVNTNFRDTMIRFAKVLSRISKDLLRFLLEDLSIETQANIGDHSLKPLLYVTHGNGKQELNHDDFGVLFLSHNIDIRDGDNDRSALFLARLGTQLQTWSEGKYKAPFWRSPRDDNASGEVCIEFALIQHH